MQAKDFRNGHKFDYNGVVMIAISFSSYNDTVTVEAKNCFTKQNETLTFKTTDPINLIYPTTKECSFEYVNNDTYTFMDNDTFELIEADKATIPDNFIYAEIGTNCILHFYRDKVFDVQLPRFIKMKVTDIKINGNKRYAYLNNNIVVEVANYVNINDYIGIDTVTGLFNPVY